MKRTILSRVVLAAMVVVAGAGAESILRGGSNAQTAQAAASGLPVFEVDRTWPQVPAKWKLGDPSSFAVDAQDRVWLLHRPRTLKPDDAPMAAPPVMVFDTAGKFVKAWGGAGTGYEWPEREHGIHVDNKGFVWISGNNCPTNGLAGLKPVADDQVLKFTQDGRFVSQIGRSNQSKGNTDTRNLHRAADMWVHPRTNELFVADGYGNHRIVVFDAGTGAFKRMWGAFGNKPVDDDHCEVVTPRSFPDGPGPQNFSIVHAVRVANDGMVYVADRENRRVQTFTSDGKFVKQLVKTATPFARDLALSPDREQRFLYVGNGEDIVVLDRQTLEIAGSIKVPGMIGGGHQIATDSKGNLYIAQTTAGMQKLAFKGMSSPSNATIFEGARLIAGDGGAAIESSAFIVENNRFTRVGRRGEIQAPAGATRVDLTGKTVMPAKVDMHGHLGYENVVEGTTSKANFTRENLIDHLERFAYMGFSAVVSIADLAEREIMPADHLDLFQSPRDPKMPREGRFPWGKVPLRVRDEVIPNAALFRTAGPGIAWPGAGAGGHPSRNDVMYPVMTVEDARRAVRDYVETKPEFVKIWVDNRGGTLKTLTPDLYRAILDEATKFNIPVAAHTVTLADAKELYKAGLEGATHIPVRGGDLPDAELLAIVRERVAKSRRPIWFNEPGSPTALGPQAWDDPLLWEMLPRDQVQKQQGEELARMTPEVVARARQSSKGTGDAAKMLIKAGMKLVYGSDNGSAGRGFGWYEQLRFENWVTMGFTPAEAIVMATRDSAEVAKIDTGMVVPGKSADFIVLDANPLENIANTRRINKVYLRGQEVDRAGMRARWQARWNRATP